MEKSRTPDGLLGQLTPYIIDPAKLEQDAAVIDGIFEFASIIGDEELIAAARRVRQGQDMLEWLAAQRLWLMSEPSRVSGDQALDDLSGSEPLEGSWLAVQPN